MISSIRMLWANLSANPRKAVQRGYRGRPVSGARYLRLLTRSLKRACLLAVLNGLLILSCQRQPVELKHLGIPAAFALTDQDGQPYHYTPVSGTVRLLFFGYTSCPDFCPATLSKLQTVYASLPGEMREKPEVLFISIDPERDTPAVLKSYLAHFSLPARGLSGTKKDLEPVARSFGTFYRVEKKGKDVFVDHSTYLYLVDPEGELRHLFKSGDSAETITEGVLNLFAEMN